MVLFDRATPGSLGCVMIPWKKKGERKKKSQELLEVVVTLLRDSRLIKWKYVKLKIKFNTIFGLLFYRICGLAVTFFEITFILDKCFCCRWCRHLTCSKLQSFHLLHSQEYPSKEKNSRKIFKTEQQWYSKVLHTVVTFILTVKVKNVMHRLGSLDCLVQNKEIINNTTRKYCPTDGYALEFHPQTEKNDLVQDT